MIAMLTSAAIAFSMTLLLTPFAIRFSAPATSVNFIQEEVEGHQHKMGTPTMGGLVFIVAVVAAGSVAM